MLPERFKLEYTDAAGEKKRPVLIHRAPLGSLERWMAVLIEHYTGAFPLWLAPVQVVIFPISEKHLLFGRKLLKQLKDLNVRAELDDRSKTLGSRIRDAEMQKVPYLIIQGDKEIKANKLAVRQRGKGNLGTMDINKFIGKITKEINAKIL